MSFTYLYLKTRDEVACTIANLNSKDSPVVLDIETTGLDRFKDKLVSIQLCIAGEETAYYFDAEFANDLKHLSTPLVLHNFRFDFAFLFHHTGIDLRKQAVGVQGDAPRWIRDTMLLHHLLDENVEHSLDSLVKARWDDPYKELFWSRNKSFHEAAEDERLEYACKDVIYTGKLYQQLLRDLHLSGMPSSLTTHVHNFALALYDTELRGVRVDLDYLAKIGTELKQRIDSAHVAMRAAAPEVELVELDMWAEEMAKRKTPRGRAGVKRPKFNWDSTKQLQALLHGHLGIREVRKKSKQTKKFSASLDDASLEELRHEHPVIAQIQAHRENQKVYGSFIEGTLEKQVGGRVYPSFNVNGTVTGRISSSNPNLQQLPREGGVRGSYVPDSGHLLVSCDYAQLEVVVAAHYSREPNLLRIIFEGASKHDITAHGLGISRQQAKTINFAMQYGATEHKIKEILNCSQASAKDALRKYWETYAGERKVIDECNAKVDQGKPIVSIFGRQRRFPKTFANKWDKERAYRQAYSSLIQGTGADLTHTAFYTFAEYMDKQGLGRALFEVHDEILGEAHEHRVDEAIEAVQRIMIQAGVTAGLSVPLTVDCSSGLKRWEK